MYDVITMGRISVDVYPQQVGVSLREVTSFGKFLGGSSTNVAVAAARYGRLVATITRTGRDPFGEYLHDALKAGRRFTVWSDPRLNTVATPTLATDAGELILRAIERHVTGTLHCVGGEHIDRVSLARRAVAAFGLDDALLDTGAPPPGAEGPHDTSLDAKYTAQALGVELRGIDSLLTELWSQLEEAWSAACTT